MTSVGRHQGHNSVTLLVLGLLYSACSDLAHGAIQQYSMSTRSAPRIVLHPDSQSAFREGEEAVLPCNAEADREITYEWRKDNQLLPVATSGKYDLRQGQGSLLIRSPNAADQGVYQCFARTDFGTSISTKTVLKAAVLESFPTVISPPYHQPEVGQPLNLSCNAPRSYPTGRIYWGLSTLSTESSKLEGIDNDDRIILDHNGRLYFANILPKDSLDEFSPSRYYACIVKNQLLGKTVMGNEHKVNPKPISDANIRKHAPQLMWSSPVHDKAVQGENKRLKCIFSGLPTPRVSWRRIGPEMSSRVVVTPEGHRTEIEVQKIEFSDSGTYECTATNSEGSSSRQLTLAVESMPYWRQNKVPMDADVQEDDPVQIECLADGSPRPVIEWYIDGIPIQNVTQDARRRVESNRISYTSVTISKDRHVFQCMASNEHGQILANIVLNIQASSPSFLSTPADTKVVQGQDITLPCHPAGAPKPKVTWRDTKTGRSVEGNRFKAHLDGSLEIKNAELEDSGFYECFIENKFGNDSVRAKLLVRKPTIIDRSPGDMVANVTDDVTLQCDVTTDPEEASNLKVTWKKNGVQIDGASDRRLTIDRNDFSLTIRSAEVDDTAVYACNADNGLDNATSNGGLLTVRGSPKAPTDVYVTCSHNEAVVRWRPATNNNDMVNEYIVYYNRTDDPSGHATESARVVSPQRDQDIPMEFFASVALHPWGSFSHFVVAVNSMGQSPPGQASGVCTTPPALPSRNPHGVCTKLTGPKQLIIVWEMLPREERNGDGFHYRVGYKRRDVLSANFEERIVSDPHQTELVIHDQENFHQFEIYVQSTNKVGNTPLRHSDRRIGYSGEGKPTVIPTNVNLNDNSLNSTYVELTWNSVDTSQEKINGFFKGYRIEFWRANLPEEKRHEDIILNPTFDPCPPLSGKERRRRHFRSHEVKASTNNLWPNSHIKAGVMVLNQANYGRLSDVVEFQTPEGVPDAVTNLAITEVGSNHLLVEWSKPIEENGIITGYILTYEIAPPHKGTQKQRFLSESKFKLKILDLSPSSSYVVSVAAVTSAGKGYSSDAIGRTLPDADPSKPLIGDIEVGDNSANVSWIPAGNEAPGNPGSRFYVEYRELDDTGGDNMWNETQSVTEDNWTVVSDLKPGKKYEFRVVSVNGLDENERESKSDVQIIYIPMEGERRTKTPPVDGMLVLKRGDSAVWWFIVLMGIIILLLVVLAVVCLLYRSHGQIYLVYEKERLWGNPHKDEDQPFGEYARENPPLPSNADLRRSRESLESDQKPLESESSDSIGDYDDSDPAKFNEDGSFIGAYNRNRGSGSATGHSRRSASKQRRKADSPRANTYV